MKLHALCLGLTALGSGCLHAGKEAPPPAATVAAPAATGAGDARAAVQRGLVFLQREGDWWMTGGKGVPGGGACVSCHVVTFALWGHREAGRAGVPFEEAPVARLEEHAFRYFAEHPGQAHAVTWGQMLLARKTRGASDEGSRQRWPEVEEKLVALQNKTGHWAAGGQFPEQRRPEAESDAVVTMWNLIALAALPDPSPKILAGRERAWKWVQPLAPGKTSEWALTRMLVEDALGSKEAAAALQARLLERQRPDGGWAWAAETDEEATVTSDALTTGQVIFALSSAGLDRPHPALRRAVDYLTGRQRPSGEWIVPAGLISTRNEPAGKIQYIYKFWGTAWATIGLARTLRPTAESVRTAQVPVSK